MDGADVVVVSDGGAMVGLQSTGNALRNACDVDITDVDDEDGAAVPRLAIDRADCGKKRFVYNVALRKKFYPADEEVKSLLCPKKWTDPPDLILRWQRMLNLAGEQLEDPFWMMENVRKPKESKKSKRPPIKLLSSITHVAHRIYRAEFNYLGLAETIEFAYSGALDADGRFHDAAAALAVANATVCPGCLRAEPACLLRMRARFDHGDMQGRLSMAWRDFPGGFAFAGAVDSALDGPLVVFGKQPLYEKSPKRAKLYRENGLAFLGRFRRGRPVGKAWIGMVGGGHLYGRADPDFPGTVTDEAGAFLYEGNEVAIVGRFRRNVMVRAFAARVRTAACGADGVAKPDFDVVSETTTAFWYAPSTNASFGVPPFDRDPYEAEFVAVRPSGVAADGAGFGLFALRDMAAKRLAAPLNAYRYVC